MADIQSHETKAPDIQQKLAARSAHVGIIGMGYVGLPTMVAIAEAGFRVTGIDISESRVDDVNAGKSYVEDVDEAVLRSLVKDSKLSATTDHAVINDLDAIIVCVPTPITRNKEPDLKPLEQASDALAANLRRGQLVVLQSTTYPGTTQEIVLPKLEQAGFQAGSDFYLAYALERIDPGNKDFVVRDVPKVVGGVTPNCTRLAVEFLSTFVDRVVPVSSPRVAEMTKLLENTFRSVNIALANEFAMLCDRMKIDIWEVIEAASTKPFGFMPFYPGPGVGGHCIPVDPFYLSWKAKEYDFYLNFIQLAAQINDNMPYYTLSRIVDILGDRGKMLRGSRLLVLGAAFKENVRDARNAPSVRVMQLLLERGSTVEYNDSNVPTVEVNGQFMNSVSLDDVELQQFDATVVLVGHDYYDWEHIVGQSSLVIDTRNATRALGARANIVKL